MHRLAPARERFDAILLDLDGTLLDYDARVSVRTWRAVRALVDAGFEVMLCSGRSLAGCRSIHRGLGLPTPIAAYNGNWIGFPGQRPWRVSAIQEPFLADIERTEAAAHFCFRHEGERKHSVPGTHRHYERVARWYGNVVRVPRPDGLPRHDLMRVSCFFGGEAETHAAWDAMDASSRRALALQQYPLGLFPEFADSELHLGEIQPRTRGKAQALEWLEKERGILSSRVVAVGDQRNDVEMLEAAGLAVAMENAVDEVQALADLVIGHHDEDGIAAWVEAGLPTRGNGNGNEDRR